MREAWDEEAWQEERQREEWKEEGEMLLKSEMPGESLKEKPYISRPLLVPLGISSQPPSGNSTLCQSPEGGQVVFVLGNREQLY